MCATLGQVKHKDQARICFVAFFFDWRFYIHQSDTDTSKSFSCLEKQLIMAFTV
jgi:hypothetical protein